MGGYTPGSFRPSKSFGSTTIPKSSAVTPSLGAVEIPISGSTPEDRTVRNISGDKFSQEELARIQNRLNSEMRKARTGRSATSSSRSGMSPPDIRRNLSSISSTATKTSTVRSTARAASPLDKYVSSKTFPSLQRSSYGLELPSDRLRGSHSGFAFGDNIGFDRLEIEGLVRESRRVAEEMSKAQEVAALTTDAWRGDGPNSWRYAGDWLNGTMHGNGRLSFRDGWDYSGTWINGLMDGEGTLQLPDGTVYEGGWEAGYMQGEGTLTYPDGWQFVGEWDLGRIGGQGVLVQPGN